MSLYELPIGRCLSMNWVGHDSGSNSSVQQHSKMSSRALGSQPSIDTVLPILRGEMRSFLLSVHPDLLHDIDADVRQSNEAALMVTS